MKIKIYLTFVILISISISLASQTTIDSLEKIINSSNVDSVKFIANLNLAVEYYKLGDINRTNEYIENSKKHITSNINMPNAYKKLSNLYKFAEKYDSAAYYSIKVAEYHLEQGDKLKYVENMNWAGYYYTYTGDNDKAVEIMLENLRYAEQNNLNEILPETYMFLGFGTRQNNKEKALEYFELSIEHENDTLSGNYHTSLNEIGNIYNSMNKPEKALPYYLRSLKIREITNNTSIVYSYHDIALVYETLEEYEKSINYLKKCIEILEKNNYGLYEICTSYSSLGRIYLKYNDLNQSLFYLNKSLELAKTINNHTLLIDIYSNFYHYYKSINNYQKALEYFELQIIYYDSLKYEETTQKIAELDKKYQTEKKETEILLLQKEKETNKATIQKQKIIGIAGITILLLITFLAIVFLRGRQKQKKANKLLIVRNEEIRQQREEIQSIADNLKEANKEINSKNSKLIQANELISHKNKNITDSIQYAKKIQNAVLPTNDLIENNFTDSFIFYKPRDIVSGDFYWFKKIDNHIFIAVADCTGHGVPGAFMSMLGISLLNEIITEISIKDTGSILDLMRNRVKTTLKQTGKEDEQKDGMDMSLCIIDTNNLKLQYSGANSPAYIITENFENKSSNNIYKKRILSNEKFNLIEILPNRQPVAVYISEKPFITNTLTLNKNDKIYLFTDGYVDQIGGEDGNKKFLSKQFKELLLNTNDMEMKEQQFLLTSTITEWIGKNKQLDDMLIIGVQV